jgi:hypothetical protein
MSYSANMRDVRDTRLPLRYRVSHLRSCANHMAEKYRVARSVILEGIQIKATYGGDELPSEEAILRAALLLDQIKRQGFAEPENPEPN